MKPTIEILRGAGVLSPVDVHFARSLERIGREADGDVLLAAALASRWVSAGHVCFEPAVLAPRAPAAAAVVAAPAAPAAVEGMDELDDVEWPEPEAWLASLRRSALCGRGPEPTPLVVDDGGRVYLRRYWQDQRLLADAIGRRARHMSPVSDDDVPWLRSRIDALFGPPSVHPDLQRVAAAVACERRFCVISGGPGTGKTATVVKLLVLAAERAARREKRSPRVLLVAPTGKAAARLVESIGAALGALDVPASIRAVVPTEASTLHRALGAYSGGRGFRHGPDDPLVADLVLVDEASMVDLALMARLVSALPAQASLILLGDRDQLASVEAGAVLADVCGEGRGSRFSRSAAARVQALCGETVPDDGPGGVGDCIVQLEHSYRYSAGSGIGALARAIHRGDAAAALEVLRSDVAADVVWIDSDTVPFEAWLWRSAVASLRGAVEAQTPAAALAGLERYRVLCALRRGPRGVVQVNRVLAGLLEEAGALRVRGEEFAGRAVGITTNDYQLGLFNGDVGIVRRGGDGGLVAWFAAPPGATELRRFPPSRLPEHETVFAMTVHKSQGSELDEVALVLPERPAAVLSRELIYTAVTRARRRVTVYGSAEVLAAAIARRVERPSGLRDALWSGE